MKTSFFSKNVEFLIKNGDVNQKELAEILDIGSTAISKWKGGEGFPNVNTLLNFAAYYGVQLESLFFINLEQEKKDSSHPDFKIGNTTFGELSEEVRRLREEFEAMKKGKM